MALTEEEIKNLKAQLSEQIQHLPEDQKAEAQKQIDALSAEALEIMLKQQKSRSSKEKSVFRLIIEKQIPSYQIDENSQAIAVLEINPISQGHVIIIPKLAARNSKEIPNQAFSLAKKISKRIISKLKANSTEIQTESKFGEIIINIIPIYDKPLDINSPRTKAEKSELESLEKKLKAKKREKKAKIQQPLQPAQKSEILKLPRRIP